MPRCFKGRNRERSRRLLRPGFYGARRLHCASLPQSGRGEEARAFLSIVRRNHRPARTIAWVRENVPTRPPSSSSCSSRDCGRLVWTNEEHLGRANRLECVDPVAVASPSRDVG